MSASRSAHSLHHSLRRPLQIPQSHQDILSGHKAVVSTIRHQDGMLATHPVSFEWDGEHIRFSTLKQRHKYLNLLHNPKLSICLLCHDDFTRYIEIRGHAVLQDDPDKTHFLSVWKRQTGLDTFDYDPPGAQRVSVTVIPEQVSTPTLYGGRLSQRSQRSTTNLSIPTQLIESP